MLHDQHEPVDLKIVLLRRSYKQVTPTFVLGAAINDIPDIKSINNFEYRDTDKRQPFWFKALSKLSVWRTPDQLSIIGEIMDRVKIPRKKFFFAVNEDEIIGTLLAIHDKDYLGLMNLTVSEKYQRLGIGTQLCSNAIKWGQQNGAKFVYLQVEKTNKPAIELYNKFQFKKWYSYTYYEKISKK